MTLPNFFYNLTLERTPVLPKHRTPIRNPTHRDRAIRVCPRQGPAGDRACCAPSCSLPQSSRGRGPCRHRPCRRTARCARAHVLQRADTRHSGDSWAGRARRTSGHWPAGPARDPIQAQSGTAGAPRVARRGGDAWAAWRGRHGVGGMACAAHHLADQEREARPVQQQVPRAERHGPAQAGRASHDAVMTVPDARNRCADSMQWRAR